MGEQFYETVPGSMRHVKPLSVNLRPAACVTLRAFGADPRRALHQAVRQSSYCRAAILDGQPVAMWGAAGAMLGGVMTVWAALGNEAVRYPLAIVRRARQELENIAQGGTELQAMVDEGDERALLFAKTIGFGANPDFEVPQGMLAMRFGGLSWHSR